MARIPGNDSVAALVRAGADRHLQQVAALVAGPVGQLAQGAGQAAAELAGRLLAAAGAAADSAAQARETVAAVHRLAVRADSVVAELEEPLRALAPGLGRLARALDDPLVEDLPRSLAQVQADLLPVLRALADTSERVTVLAGSTERIMGFVDDTSRTLAGFPGASLLGRRRPAGRVVTVEQDPAPPA